MMNPAEFANIAATERDFWWYQGMLRILKRLLQRYLPGSSAGRVLEAGSGTGYIASLMQKCGWSYFPIDLGWEGLKYGREMGVKHQTQADIAALPFSDATFDTVLSLDVIVHFPLGQETRAFQELARVLRPRGRMILRVSALDLLRSRHSAFAHERQRFSRTRLVRQVSDCGIRVLRCTYANSLLMPVALFKFRIWEELLRRPPSSGVEPVSPLLNRLLYFPLWLESLWLGAGFNFPIGQSLILIGEKVA